MPIQDEPTPFRTQRAKYDKDAWGVFMSNEAVERMKNKGSTAEQLRGMGVSEELIRMPYSPSMAGKTPFTELTEEQLISGGYTDPRYRENPPSYGAPYWINKEGEKVYEQPEYTLSDALEDEANNQIPPNSLGAAMMAHPESSGYDPQTEDPYLEQVQGPIEDFIPDKVIEDNPDLIFMLADYQGNPVPQKMIDPVLYL